MEILDDFNIEEKYSNKEHEWALFIGERADYYLPIWKKIEQGEQIHFNLAALVFSTMWLAYRKMYLPFLLFIGALFFGGFATSFFAISNDYKLAYQGIQWVFYFWLALRGNKLYYDHAQRTIQKIKQTHPNIQKQHSEIQRQGNVNAMFPIIIIVISIIFNMIIRFV